MTESTTDTRPTIYPALRYEDAPAAIDWLCKAFGFEQHLVVPNPDGTIAHAELKLGNGMIMLGSAREDARWKTARRLGAVTGTLYVYVPDVDAHYERAKAAGAEIRVDPYSTEYGSREYGATDPEGYIWTFGTYRP